MDEENGLLVRYLNDRLTALSSNYPGKNLVEILQQYYYQTDMLKYVSQFDFPLDYVGPEYHVCFRDTTLLQRAVEMGYHVAEPGGAFYLFPRTLEPDDVAFSERAKQFDLLLVPGSGFGAPGHVRIAYCVQTEMIQRALPRFKALVDSYKK